jgi:putative membrane protein
VIAMMYGRHHGFSGWDWLAMSLTMALLWLLIVGAVVLAVRLLSRRSHGAAPQGSPSASTATLLAERFARGEIGEEEYQRRLTVLHSTPNQPETR